MQQLWFLRHGEAEPHDSSDDWDRRLTARGERQADAAGKALARLGIEFDAVFSSPKVRALDTAKLACESLGVDPVVHDELESGFGRSEALELMAGHGADARVLVVGHEPDFSTLIGELTGGRVDVKKGGIAAVRLDGSKGGEAAVVLRPREIETLAA